MAILNIVTLLSLALLTGNEFCVAFFIEPLLRAMPDSQQIGLVPGFAGRLGKFMPPWYAITLLLTAALAVMRYRAGAGIASGAGLSLALQLVVLATTLTLLVPRNTRLAKMHAAYPSWKDDASQWDRLHQVRVALLLLATITLAFAG